VLEAPRKRLVIFNTAGHRPLWEQPAQFQDLMVTVLADTEGARR
jgi:pimeloyl-ACP methyl ester carboxylesterase